MEIDIHTDRNRKILNKAFIKGVQTLVCQNKDRSITLLWIDDNAIKDNIKLMNDISKSEIFIKWIV